MSKKLIYVILFALLAGVVTTANAVPLQGKVRIEWWGDIGGTAVTDLTGNAAYPDNPSGSDFLTSGVSFNEPGGTPRPAAMPGDNYGTRVQGYIYPPQTGDYVFSIGADDNAALFLSTDDDPANAVQVSTMSAWGAYGDFADAELTPSGNIPLVAGQKYYFYALQKEGTGGDNMAVGWSGPGIGTTATIIAAQYVSGYVTAADYVAQNPSPADGATHNQTAGLLQWTPGVSAAQHHVYFGTNEADVTTGAGGTDKGLFTQASYIATGLVPGTTYYWRVDEVNDAVTGSPWTGDVWSFTVADTKAYNPNPADGMINHPKNGTLTWSPGLGVSIQEFFIGTDYNTVLNAAPGGGALIGSAGTRTVSGQADGTTYYWRVDTYDQSYQLVKGDVWSYTTIPFIPVTDPNKLAHYLLDEGQGTTIIDSSGYNHHAVADGNPDWVAEAVDGGGLHFDGVDDGVHIGAIGLAGTASRTVTAWAKADNTNIPTWTTVFGFSGPTSGNNLFFDLCRLGNQGNGYGIHRYGWEMPITASLDLEWNHLAATLTNGDTVQWFHNGVSQGSESALTPNITDDVRMGIRGDNSNKFIGVIDDCRIYDYAMDAAAIKEVMRGDPTKAYDPDPRSGSSVSIDAVATISWSAGEGAVQHDVYFGTDSDTVKNATTADAEYKGRQTGTSYVPPAVMGQTYYWRIDEVAGDSSVSIGRLWSFTVLEYLVVDDFESYGTVAQINVEGQRIWYVWLDGYGYTTPPPGYGGNGSGSMVDLGAVSVSGQSLRLDFNNTTVPYSVVEAATSNLLVGSNWNRNGVKALALSYRGYPASIGGVTQNGTQYTINGAGADVWNVLYPGEAAEDGYHDEFHYMYVAMTPGTHTITAKVESLVNTNGWAKVGVMIRDSLDPKSQHVFAAVTPTSGIVLQNRPSLGAGSYNPADEVRDAGTLAPATAPVWLRLTRETDGSIEGRYSTDGSTWTLIVTEDAPLINITGTMYMGLAVCSHVAGTATTAVFSDVKVNGSPITGWSNQDVGILSNNGTDPLYVQLATGGTTKRIPHPDPMAIQSGAFQQWNIALSDFSPVSVSNVTNIAVGTGTPGGSLGTSGTVYVDDIRLYRPRYLAGMVTPWAQDIYDNRDGRVDFRDVDRLVAGWLQEDYFVTAVNPGTNGLVAYYPLDAGFNDTIGGHNGTAGGDAVIVADGVRGNVAAFDGAGDFVGTGTWNPSATTGQLSVSLWAKWAGLSNAYQGLIGKRDTWAANDMMWQIEANINTGHVSFMREGSPAASGNPVLPTDEWAHVAATFDGTTATLYINGRATGSSNFSFGTDPNAALVFGACQAGGGNPFNGDLDEIRIFNRGLSEAEVAYLACEAAGQCHIPVVSLGNLSNTEPEGQQVVNFKDLAVLLDKFMTTQVWPEP